MKNITQEFGTIFYPSSALVFYQSKGLQKSTYVEYFDFDKVGKPKDAHPLSVNEGTRLAKALNIQNEHQKKFLDTAGLIPPDILKIDSKKENVLWYTPPCRRNLFFVERLEIPNGSANIPALLWSANKEKLTIFALAGNRRPGLKTVLYYAPFFNVSGNGKVCMGTVDINIKNSASVEEFMRSWEDYFFNSYFSHLLNNHNPVNGNCVSLWKGLIGSEKKFPKAVLRKSNLILKNLLP